MYIFKETTTIITLISCVGILLSVNVLWTCDGILLFSLISAAVFLPVFAYCENAIMSLIIASIVSIIICIIIMLTFTNTGDFH